MNKAKRLLALATLLVFMFTTYTFSVSAAGVFSDVDPSHQYAEAIQKLYDNKIVDGYLAEDGTRTFMPENTITRAEFAKLLAVSLVPDQGLLAATPTGFADVDKDEKISWAIPYISYAVQSKIVNGYPDGTFQPFKEVTYAEAVKMVVCALGYGAQVETTDPWYEGYLKIGRNVGALDNALSDANTASKRGLVAQLIMNLKNVQDRNSKLPIILPDIGGGEGGGNNGGAIVLPDDEEDVYEDYGQITAIFDSSLSGANLDLSKDEITIDNRKYILADNLSYETFVPYLGYLCDFEYIEQKNKKIIQKLTISNDYTVYDFNSPSDFEFIDDNTIEFYKDESSSKATKLNIATAQVMYNGYGIATISSSDRRDLIEKFNGSLKLHDNESDRRIDVIHISTFDTYFVGSVVLDTNTVYDKNMKDDNGNLISIVLDEDNDSTFETDKGVASAITALKKNVTTISVCGPYRGQDYTGVETKTRVIISNKKVTGNVSSYDASTNEYTIGTKKYKTSSYYDDLIEKPEFADQKINVGDSGTYYLDHLNKIVFVAVNDSSKYGYISDIEIPANADRNNYVIYMVTNSGQGSQLPSEFTLRDRVTINGKDYDFDQVADRLRLSASVINATKSVTSINADFSQPIIFKTTVDGGTVIKSITTVDAEVEGETNPIEYNRSILTDDTIRSDYPSTNIFKNDDKTFLSMRFSTSSTTNPTKVFVVPINRNDDEDYAVYTKSTDVSKYFTVGNTYLVEGFNVSESKIAEIVVVYGATPLVITGQTPAYLVKRVKPWEDDKSTGHELMMYELGKKEPLETTEVTSSVAVAADIKAGDIIKFAKRGDKIELIEKVFVDGQLYEPFNGDIDVTQSVAATNRIDEKYGTTVKYFTSMVGIVYLSDESVLQIIPGITTTLDEESDTYADELASIVENDLQDYTTSSSTYVYIYDGQQKLENRVKFVNTDSLTYVSEHGIQNASRVYMYRLHGGTIKCIVVYRNMDFLQ